MKPAILLFEIPEAKRSAIAGVAVRLGIRLIVVGSDCYGQPLDTLFTEDTPRIGGTVGGEMLVLCDIPSRRMDPLLSGLRNSGAAVAIKAVLTETNRTWSAEKLYAELCAEREAFLAQKEASIHG